MKQSLECSEEGTPFYELPLTNMVRNEQPQRDLSPRITSLLSALRWRIRAYVWMEGLTLAAVWLGLTFWIGLAIDYLPVRMGASEMPVAARVVLLLLIAAVFAFILYRFVLRRAFTRLANRSMAVLLERRFPDFDDSLLTAVELRERSAKNQGFSLAMLAYTDRQALTSVDQVRLRRVFNFLPLLRNLTMAAVVLLSVVLFGLLATDAFAIWVNRLYLLSSQPWPRRTQIEILGFTDNCLKAAKGSSVTIHVRANAQRPTPPPDVCTIYYRTAEGERGRVNMTKNGAVRNGFQEYHYVEKPFKGILSNIRFDVVGDDHRLRDYEVLVVDSPSVIEVELDCELPSYTQLSPRTETWRPGIRLPKGTRVTLRLKSNKDLIGVKIADPNGEDSTSWLMDATLDPPAREFAYNIENLDRDRVLDITLEDTDGLRSRQPHRVTIDAIDDRPPVVDVQLRGIGSAVTTQAQIPVSGEISDDYGVDRAWFDLEIKGSNAPRFPCRIGASGKVDDRLDLRAQQTASESPLQLQEGGKIVLAIKAADRYDLSGEANVGEGDRYELDVVTPSDLLALLESRELGLRRRYELMIVEMQETRDSLARVRKRDISPRNQGLEPEDTAGGSGPSENVSHGETDEVDSTVQAQRAQALRSLRVQRATQHSQRAAQEVLGVAASFDDIREELINNRIDSQERKERIEQQISAPLKQIADTLFPEWDEKLKVLQSQVDTVGTEADPALDRAVDQADRILVAMEMVLEKMLEVEDFNELVDMVRSLIREQEELIQRTKQEHKKRLFGPLGSGL